MNGGRLGHLSLTSSARFRDNRSPSYRRRQLGRPATFRARRGRPVIFNKTRTQGRNYLRRCTRGGNVFVLGLLVRELLIRFEYQRAYSIRMVRFYIQY